MSSLSDVLRSGFVSGVEVRGNSLVMNVDKNVLAEAIRNAVDPRLRGYVSVDLKDNALIVSMVIPDADLKPLFFSGLDERVRNAIDVKIADGRIELWVRLV